MSVINVEHISKLYGDKMILEDLSCSVDEGDKIGIIGINGTGKSTLLRIIAGEEEADEGKIIFSNGMTIGWMGQNPEFDEESSILKYVCEGKKIEDDYGYESDAKAMLTVLELENFDEKIKNLSGGQKKRAALCKVLLQKPDILILDEPTSGLDPLMQNKFVELIHKAKKEGKTILMSSHIFEEVEHTCDRVVIIKEGEIVATEKMEDLRHSRRKYYEICFHDVKEATLFHQQYPESQVRDTVVSLSLQGSADTLIKALSQYTIDDLSVRVQSLEELFLHYYGGNQS